MKTQMSLLLGLSWLSIAAVHAAQSPGAQKDKFSITQGPLGVLPRIDK